MAIRDFIDRQPPFSEQRLRNSIPQIAKAELVGSDAKDNRRANVLPAPRAAAQVHAAAIGNQARLHLCVWGAENNWIVGEVGVYVTERREQGFKPVPKPEARAG